MKKILWLIFAIFTLELLGIVGYYWIFQGYAGNTELTVSRYIGLSPVSSAIFLIGNLVIIVLAMIYMLESGIKSTLWRILIGVFAVCFLMLSICPHVPDNAQIIFIHRFFAGGLFVSLLILAMVTTSLTDSKLAKAFCFFYIVYGACYFTTYLSYLPNYSPYSLIIETLYIYGGLTILALAKPKAQLNR